MSTIVTRAGKGSPLTNTELDSNFTNLNTDKLELSGGTLTGNLSLGDNVKLQLGNQTNGDLQLYHDGTHSYVDDSSGTGRLILKTDYLEVQNAAGNEAILGGIQDGAVSLFYDGNTKLATTTTGIDVTGSVTADGLTVEGATTPVIRLESETSFLNVNTAGKIEFYTNDASTNATGVGAEIVADSVSTLASVDLIFKTRNSAVSASTVERFKVANNGDISFYNDSAAQAFHFDSSESVLSLGRTNGSSYVTDSDSLYVKGQIRVDGISNTAALPALCFNDTNTGIFYPAANSIGFSVGAYESLRLNADGSSVFSGAVTAGGHIITNTSSRIENQRISMEADGTLDWGSSKQYGTLTWDTNKAIIVGQQSSSLEFRTNNTGVAMTMDTSQNVNIPNGGLMVGSTTAPSDKIEIFTTDTNSGLNLVANNGSNQNSHSPKLKFNGEYQSNGPFIQGLNTGAVGYKALVFNTVRTDNDYTTLPAESMRIDSSGNVNIATGSLRVALGSDEGSQLNAWSESSGEANLAAYILKFKTGGNNSRTERMRIDSSGNLLVGTTDTDTQNNNAGSTADNGFAYNIGSGGYLNVARYGGTVAYFNRTSTDGAIQEFRKNGATVGSIGTDSTSTYIDGGSELSGLQFGGDGTSEGRVVPRRDGAIADGETTLGTSSYRFKDLYLSGSVNGGGTYRAGNTGTGNIILEGGQHIFRFGSGGSYAERARIDTSGNLLVGKTSSGFNTAGVEFASSGRSRFTRDGANVLEVNRLSNDGSLMTFSRQGSSVGSIGSDSNSQFMIGSGDTGLTFQSNTDAIIPRNTDGTARTQLINLGTSGAQFKDLYLSGGVYLGGTGTANKLDDYEEGTWTPTAASYDGTMTVNSASYVKVGKLVTVKAKVSFDATSDGSGVSITSLPFATTGAGKANGGFVTSSTVSSAARVQAVGSSSLFLMAADDSNVTYTAMASTSLEFVFIYEAA